MELEDSEVEASEIRESAHLPQRMFALKNTVAELEVQQISGSDIGSRISGLFPRYLVQSLS